MSHWREDLVQLDLFVAPAPEDSDEEGAEDTRKGAAKDRGVQEPAEEDLLDHAADGAWRVKLHPGGVREINGMLSVARYHRRSPRMPLHELDAASVVHPHGKDEDLVKQHIRKKTTKHMYAYSTYT